MTQTSFPPTPTVRPQSNSSVTSHTPSTVSSNTTPLTKPTAVSTSEETTNGKTSSNPQTSLPMTQTSKALTSAEIISSNTVKTSTIIPLSNATVTVTTPSTTPQCRDEDCQCNGGECIFNTTLGRCHCHCQESVYGDSCVFGQNNTHPNIDSGAIPTRRVNVTMKIDITFVDAYTNLNSPESLTFINKLRKELEALCKEADPLAFKKVQIINLIPGSVVAESVAEYNYLNNETQIHYVNTKLDGVLTNILNDTNNLNKISRAFNNASVQLNGLTFQSPEIKNITDLKPFVNCSRFVDYTAVISNGQWQCVGPCKTNPDYCHHHGDCLNDIYTGSICRCYESSLEQFYGPQCEFSTTEPQSTSVTTEFPDKYRGINQFTFQNPNNQHSHKHNSASTKQPVIIYNNNVLTH
ncbi:mucin-3B-like [Thunnus albacares]|uniref:mucin-3B-like n=1 Tax=Thunnus albacares TaxID=8236 RepID=UPI001CF6365C|nr:mucin-3B-like [Thunnus albacares]